ncbi:GNAT family N-acetyltransferase [Actinomadura roseirufa]|uniref:GNAT family N-acetyltransferase n=1 Tax=Actinomadura roseirufa TaxID=2094049 RepID=UPI001A955C2C|nr:GNAT family N-acetyltransferase [Actinomadura roseirufa]
MKTTITYLEMTSSADLVPGRPAPITMEPAAPSVTRDLTCRIGVQYQWKSASWTDDQWAAYLNGPHHSWVLRLTEDIGLARYAIDGDDVEITTFGLLREWTGRGVGGHALTLVLRKAWELLPDARRVWLHTSTLDHPNALPNYRARGLRPYRTAEA